MNKQKRKSNLNTKLIATTSLFVVVTFVATAFIQMGIPGGSGYVHIGDAIILIACYFLPLPYAIAAGAIGAAFADWAAGYIQYILITILAKAVLVVSTHYVIYNKKITTWYTFPVIVLGNFISILCYAFHDLIFFGKGAFVANFTFGLIQPAFTLVISIVVLLAFSKIKVLTTFKEALNPKKYAHKRIAEEAMHVEQNIHAQELNKIELKIEKDDSTKGENIANQKDNIEEIKDDSTDDEVENDINEIKDDSSSDETI